MEATNGQHPRDIHHAMAMLTDAYVGYSWFHSIELADGDTSLVIQVNGAGPAEKPGQWMGHPIKWQKASRAVTKKVEQSK